MQEMLHLFKTVNKKHSLSVSSFYKVQGYLTFAKLLQMYRLPDAFAYFERDIFKKKSILLYVMMLQPALNCKFSSLQQYNVVRTYNYGVYQFFGQLYNHLNNGSAVERCGKEILP